ncbi:DUF3566 domain-containing protein [Corynebacterium sp. 153RC1]|uniref:DUF3566 domain-containing protein n=1 Tax=Corynebacterium TaxID=1716 RepID=UPI00211C1AE9|nr:MULTISPECIES: DUF3566 domain-containing protein [unclassified Corynebacterium]MCQ9370182.1 DUF3566 domain-containing protein [Corynebacterium sp. 35RC1]MCQ9344059.1 DUF3566 domain-containing protein [Corynebacterium sp. 76QC2CO]MCQ9352742.1 DUF3566 domain-containing protein [Corynebacterium sp. 209RC1]MCQ9354926.1 DUF3566 domain-containing protein [Corynebacterium sp. 1222RC1]MCQ9357187.1 DUF3566 domain-containing protein [Corynebacterium sp. 122RC1]
MAARTVTVTRISPLSAFRTMLALSLVGLAVWVLCVALLYLGLDAVGIWEQVNQIIGGVGGEQLITFGLVLSIASLIGAILAIGLTVLTPLAVVVYNAIVDLFGGITLTLREERD